MMDSTARFAAVAASVCAFSLLPIHAGQTNGNTSDEIVEGIREHAQPLKDSDDLDPILEMIGDRRAVLLGEASHGTQEYYAWRSAITKRLITEKDFRFIAVEGDWGASVAVDRYVRHLDGAPDSARAALDTFTRWPTWLWNNQVILELVEWLHEHNADLPEDERVGFHGIDVYGMDDSLEKTPRYVAKFDQSAAEQVNEWYDCFRPYADNVRRYLMQVQRGEGCDEPLAAAPRLLRENRDAWKEKDRHAYFHAKQNAMVVKHAERHYRTMIHRDHQSWNARAEHFYLTFERLLEYYGDEARGIVWAHNTHIGDSRATDMVVRQQVNIGQLAREALGQDDVALVGFFTYRGQVLAGAQWDMPGRVMPVARARPGSLEDVLYRVREEPFLFIMDDVRDVPEIDRRIGHRAIGVTFNPQNERQQYVPTVLIRRYDAFLFIPETTALRVAQDKPDS